MLEILKVIIIGIVEGVTEWLPISSTGHMILVDEFIQLSIDAAFKEVFLVVIQLGAIAAVGVLYFKTLNPFVKDRIKRKTVINMWVKIVIATLPAAVFGLLFDDWLNDRLYNYVVVAIMLIVYGVLFILVEQKIKGKQPVVTDVHHLSYRVVLLIGLFQVLALIPGTSRSGVTILGGLILGTSRFVATEFSFFLSIPVMAGASVLKIYKHGLNFTSAEWTVLVVGLITAFITSVFAIRFLIDFIKKHDFKAFGIYRIILGIIVLLTFL
jgi:undecaprenyl-diphosphatase